MIYCTRASFIRTKKFFPWNAQQRDDWITCNFNKRFVIDFFQSSNFAFSPLARSFVVVFLFGSVLWGNRECLAFVGRRVKWGLKLNAISLCHEQSRRPMLEWFVCIVVFQLLWNVNFSVRKRADSKDFQAKETHFVSAERFRARELCDLCLRFCDF